MKREIPLSEAKILKKIATLNPKKESIKILQDPSKYFEKYTKDIKTPMGILFSKFDILTLLKKIDTSDEICDHTTGYFLDRYEVNDWLDILTIFYQYSISMIDYIIEHHNNIVLDIYNAGNISKDAMIESIKAFTSSKNKLLKDKDGMQNCILGLEEDKKDFEEGEGYQDNFDNYDDGPREDLF